MTPLDSFGARRTLTLGTEDFEIWGVDAVPGAADLPFSLKIVLEDLLRHEDGLRLDATPVDVAQSALVDRWAAQVDGNSLIVQATREEAPEVVRRLVGAGVELFGLAPVQRNLEEVFLAITQPETQDA